MPADKNEPQHVIITGIKLSFSDVMALVIMFWLASLAGCVIVWFLWFFVGAMFHHAG